MFEQIQSAVANSWKLLFGAATEGKDDAGVVVRFLGFLQANPIFLLPLGLYLIVLGIKTTRKLITGY
jgi:hypothetical protein